MHARLTHWGPGGGAVALKGSAGLGHALSHGTPEARYETMPLWDEDRQTLLVATARLDNREELCDVFAVPVAERPTTPDGRLILRAFQRWGEDCPSHLLGDWSFAAWQARERRFFLARDQLGITGLFYYYKAPFFAFASGCEALLALPEVPCRANEALLARYLLLAPGGDLDATAWEDIRLLMPAQTLAITADSFERKTYWSLENVPEIRLKTDADYIDGFLERYRAAVKNRLRSLRPVGTTLSAGLDSGSVTVLAAEALRERGQRLTAFTSVPLHSAEHLVAPALADEWPLASAVARHWDNIEHVPVRAEDLSPLKALERSLSFFPHPIHGASNMFWFIAILAEAQSRGLGAVLIGQLGNGGISWSGGANRIFYQFMSGDWDGGRRALAAWRARQGRSWSGAIGSHLLRPLIGPLWINRRRLLRPDALSGESFGALAPSFARRINARAMLKTNPWHKIFVRPLPPREERQLFFNLSVSLGSLYQAYGAAFGLEVRDPTTDVRLLEFCFGIPDEFHVQNGEERMLVRQAMEGLMPAEAQWNTRRGRQAADVALRLLDHPAEVEDMLSRLEASPAVTARLDVQALRVFWRSLQTRVTPAIAQQAAIFFLRGIMAGLFCASTQQEAQK